MGKKSISPASVADVVYKTRDTVVVPMGISRVPSPFLPGILLSRKPPPKNGWFLERTMVEKNGGSTPRKPKNDG